LFLKTDGQFVVTVQPLLYDLQPELHHLIRFETPIYHPLIFSPWGDYRDIVGTFV
jgi:hypothetical protein